MNALTRWLLLLGIAAVPLPDLVRAATPSVSPPNTLTPEEQAAGWRLLFDGSTTAGWRAYLKPEFPEKGWMVEDGILKKPRRSGGGDIITTETFDDFELAWEWRIPPGANNGVKYFILEERRATIGHEYQMIDDRRVGDPKGRTASFYDVLPPWPDKAEVKIEAWNQSRIVVAGQRVEHWLNGQKVLEYVLGSPEVMAAVARSKFKDVPKFGTKVWGYILSTDHGDEVWYRNIKIRVPPGT